MAEQWFETWFDTNYYHLLYRNRDENEARQFIDALLRYLNPQPKAHFLDVACGKGRHSIYLHSQGYKATGVDLSSNSIEIANQCQKKDLSFYVKDIRENHSGVVSDYDKSIVHPPCECEKCKGEITEADYITDWEFDVHEYEIIVGYLCPHCSYNSEE